MNIKDLLNRRDVQRMLQVVGLAVLAAGIDWFLRGGGKLEGHPSVIDGDSLSFSSGEVRLKGIDAPEGRQTCTRGGREWPCGEDARRELQRLIGSMAVTCRSVERDQHDRHLALCSAGGRDLNAAMVRSGYAVVYGRDYRSEETEARNAHRGLWSGEFERPREWRDKHMRR